MTTASALNRVFDPFEQCLTASLAKKVVEMRADSELCERLSELATKSNEGQLSDEERAEYTGYVRGIDLISILQSKARHFLSHSGKKR